MLSRAKLSELRQAKTDEPNRLNVAMRLAGLTQVRLAEEVDLPQSQISEDVNGKYSDLSLDKARAYASIFGCTVDDEMPICEVGSNLLVESGVVGVS